MIQKILVVDDSMLSRMAIKKCLAEIGNFEIKEAADGQQGLETFKDFAPDLTFLDLTMPKMSGFEALKLIKEQKPDALVIVMTADTQKKTSDIILELGALMLLNKPPKQANINQAILKAKEALSK